MIRWVFRAVLGALAVGCLLGGLQLQRAPANPLPPLAAETGRVTYRFQGPGGAGSSVFAWTERGARYRQELGSASAPETVVGHGADFWMLHPHTKTAQHARLKPGDLWMNADSMPHVTPATGAGIPVGQGTVLGRPCEIRQLHTIRVWFWEGIPLRMERAPDSKLPPVSLVATRVETPLTLSGEQFQIPPGYTATELPNQPRSLPWTRVATAGLGVLLLLIGGAACAVELAFSRQRSREAAQASHSR
ncbi:MAG: hypothetical protein ACK47B_22780 [Armatimonadota bacterium]